MKIPQQAKRVYKGKIFDIYQWPQKMFDGSTETFEMIKRPDTVQIIAMMDGKLIMANEEQPNIKRSLSFLGGRIDKGESPIQAAKRELKEESGLTSNNWLLFKKYMPFNKMDWTMYYFVARDCKKTAKPNLENGEKIKIKKISFEEFLNNVTKGKIWDKHLNNEILRVMIKGKAELAKLKKKIFGK